MTLCEAIYMVDCVRAKQAGIIKANSILPDSHTNSSSKCLVQQEMSRLIPRNLSVNGRQDSLSSVYSSSMESLSSSHPADTSWSINQDDDQELNTSSTISQLRINTSDYDTSPADYDDDKKHSKKYGRVRKVRKLVG